MEGVRAIVLPPNREAIDNYFHDVWEPVHTLTAAVISLSPEPSNAEKFKSYIEAEEARLDARLKSVDYIIDGTDTLTLITGVGRAEKVSTLQCIQRCFRHIFSDHLSVTVLAVEAPLRGHANYAYQGGRFTRALVLP